MGNAHPSIVPYQVFPSSDGHLVIACGNDRQFGALTTALGQPELADDARFATNPARVENREVLVPLLENLTRGWTKVDLIAALEKAGVPAGPINSVAEALQDPQVAARGMLIEPEGLPGLRTPIQFSRSELETDKAAPVLGDGQWGFETG